MALVIDIADAVAALLNGEDADFSQAFTAQRKVRPSFELADLAELRVTVVPKAVETSAATRGLSQYDVQVDVGIQKKLPQAATRTPRSRRCAAWSSRSRTSSRARPLRARAGGPCGQPRRSNDPVYSVEHLAEKRVFTSVLTLTYRAMR